MGTRNIFKCKNVWFDLAVINAQPIHKEITIISLSTGNKRESTRQDLESLFHLFCTDKLSTIGLFVHSAPASKWIQKSYDSFEKEYWRKKSRQKHKKNTNKYYS